MKISEEEQMPCVYVFIWYCSLSVFYEKKLQRYGATLHKQTPNTLQAITVFEVYINVCIFVQL